jgi:hypothetical protein
VAGSLKGSIYDDATTQPQRRFFPMAVARMRNFEIVERFWGVVQLLIAIPFGLVSIVRFGMFAWLVLAGGGAFIFLGAFLCLAGILTSGYMCLCGWRRLVGAFPPQSISG